VCVRERETPTHLICGLHHGSASTLTFDIHLSLCLNQTSYRRRVSARGRCHFEIFTSMHRSTFSVRVSTHIFCLFLCWLALVEESVLPLECSYSRCCKGLGGGAKHNMHTNFAIKQFASYFFCLSLWALFVFWCLSICLSVCLSTCLSVYTYRK